MYYMCIYYILYVLYILCTVSIVCIVCTACTVCAVPSPGKHIGSSQRVLVFGELGISRSAVVCIAYLMKHNKWKLKVHCSCVRVCVFAPLLPLARLLTFLAPNLALPELNNSCIASTEQ